MKIFAILLLCAILNYCSCSYTGTLRTFATDQLDVPKNVFELNDNVYFEGRLDVTNDTINDINIKGFKVRLWTNTWITFVNNSIYYPSASDVELAIGENDFLLRVFISLKLVPSIFPVPENANKVLNFTLRMDVNHDDGSREKYEISCKVNVTNLSGTTTPSSSSGVSETSLTEESTSGSSTVDLTTEQTSTNTSVTETSTNTTTVETFTNSTNLGTSTNTTVETSTDFTTTNVTSSVTQTVVNTDEDSPVSKSSYLQSSILTIACLLLGTFFFSISIRN